MIIITFTRSRQKQYFLGTDRVVFGLQQCFKNTCGLILDWIRWEEYGWSSPQPSQRSRHGRPFVSQPPAVNTPLSRSEFDKKNEVCFFLWPRVSFWIMRPLPGSTITPKTTLLFPPLEDPVWQGRVKEESGGIGRVVFIISTRQWDKNNAGRSTKTCQAESAWQGFSKWQCTKNWFHLYTLRVKERTWNLNAWEALS